VCEYKRKEGREGGSEKGKEGGSERAKEGGRGLTCSSVREAQM